MSLRGTLSTMRITELLKWVGDFEKSGMLEVERNQICRRVRFVEGKIVACSSQDPPARFGQMLLSDGVITKEQLAEALTLQKSRGGRLGSVLCQMGLLEEDEEQRRITAKAQENIYGLFDWTDAAFRFVSDAEPHEYEMPIEIDLEEVVARGTQRRSELDQVRIVFDNSGIILSRTAEPIPGRITHNAQAMRIVGSVDGERSLAEVLLHCHTTEHTALKFLHTLHDIGIVEITGLKSIDRNRLSILDDCPIGETLPEQQSSPQAEAPTAGPIDIESLREIDFPETEEPGLESVFNLIKSERYGAALDALDQLYRRQPNNPSVRRLMLEAEGAYLDQVRNGELRADRIPMRAASASAEGLELEASEAFLLNSVDDMTDIQSLLWVAPQGELEVMRTFERLLQKGLLEMRDPAPDEKPRSVAAMLAGAFDEE